jgi:hypothetical protein
LGCCPNPSASSNHGAFRLELSSRHL